MSRIYIACLASYNNGEPHGRWIDASSDVDVMQDEVNLILAASPYPNVTIDCLACGNCGSSDSSMCATCKGAGRVTSAEEFAIHDFDGLPSSLGESCGLQAVADVVSFMEDDVPDEIAGEVYALLDDCNGNIASAKDALDKYVGTYPTFREYSDEYADECVLSGATDQTLVNYFDYESYARDLRDSMRTVDVPAGVMVFHA